jgi:taurine dioxygenase
MKRTTYGPICVEPLTGTIGAEVVAGAGIGALDDEMLAHLHQAWMDWKVLFFRDQPVTVEEHIAFGRQFGELEIHPFLPNDGHPEIVVLDTANDGPSRAERWHTDVTFRAAPPTGSILRGRIIPQVGGDTSWADMEAAYDRLDDATKERIEYMTATHTMRINFGKRLSPSALEEKLVEYPDQHHPVVRIHPITGRRSLFVNGDFVEKLDDIDPDDGARLLARLIAAATHPTFQVRFRWRVDSFAMWDNRNTQHCAAQDFGAARRRVERVTLMGDSPFGPTDAARRTPASVSG